MVVAGGRTRARRWRRTFRRWGCTVIAGRDVATVAFAPDDRALRFLTRLERLQDGGLVAGGGRQAGLVVDADNLDAGGSTERDRRLVGKRHPHKVADDG